MSGRTVGGEGLPSIYSGQVRGKVFRSIAASRLDKSGRVITAIDRNFARSLRRFNFWQRIGMYDVRTLGPGLDRKLTSASRLRARNTRLTVQLCAGYSIEPINLAVRAPAIKGRTRRGNARFPPFLFRPGGRGCLSSPRSRITYLFTYLFRCWEIIDRARKYGSIGFEEEARVARLKRSLKLRLRGDKRVHSRRVVVDSTGKVRDSVLELLSKSETSFPSVSGVNQPRNKLPSPRRVAVYQRGCTRAEPN